MVLFSCKGRCVATGVVRALLRAMRSETSVIERYTLSPEAMMPVTIMRMMAPAYSPLFSGTKSRNKMMSQIPAPHCVFFEKQYYFRTKRSRA